ncbi:MAG: hypothetical protein QG635_967 [Bacteroidota bacterium]|nr:hypothetical protein [Bacteroidota bacterium]
MEENNRIIELLADMLEEQRQTNIQLGRMDVRLENLEHRIIGLEKQQQMTNLAIGELRLSVMKLADKLEIVFEHEKRIDRLEATVFHN